MITLSQLARALNAFPKSAISHASVAGGQNLMIAASISAGVDAVVQELRSMEEQRIAHIAEIADAIGKEYPATTTRQKIELARRLLETFDIRKR